MWNNDLRRYAPDSYVSSVIIDFGKFSVDQVRKRLARTWVPGNQFLGMGSGVDRDKWGEKVPLEVSKATDMVRDKILAGWIPSLEKSRTRTAKSVLLLVDVIHCSRIACVCGSKL